MGQCFVPLTVTAISNVAANEAGLASALLNTGQQVGGALGLSVLGTIAISSARHYATAHHGATFAAITTHGYTRAFMVGSVLMGVGLLISLLFIREPQRAVEGEVAGADLPAMTH